MSYLVDSVDAIVADLTANVPGLEAENCPNVHRYSAWNPEILLEDGQRHLAVFSNPEAEVGGLYTAGSREVTETYTALVWESSGTEATRLVEDEDGARALYELADGIRVRFWQPSQVFGGAWKTALVSVKFPEAVSLSRWAQVDVTSNRWIPMGQ